MQKVSMIWISFHGESLKTSTNPPEWEIKIKLGFKYIKHLINQIGQISWHDLQNDLVSPIFTRLNPNLFTCLDSQDLREPKYAKIPDLNLKETCVIKHTKSGWHWNSQLLSSTASLTLIYNLTLICHISQNTCAWVIQRPLERSRCLLSGKSSWRIRIPVVWEI